jgi:hypothetical protein
MGGYNHFEEEEWSCCFLGLLVVEAGLKRNGRLLSIGYINLLLRLLMLLLVVMVHFVASAEVFAS